MSPARASDSRTRRSTADRRRGSSSRRRTRRGRDDAQAAGECVAYYRRSFAAYNAACGEPVVTRSAGETRGQFVVRLTSLLAKKVGAVPDLLACARMFGGGTKAAGEPCSGAWECKLAERVTGAGAVGASCRPRQGTQEKVCHNTGFAQEGGG